MTATPQVTRPEGKKDKIRDRYKGVDPSKIKVIPAKPTSATMDLNERHLRVAAYIRVSTENDEQTSSFELQNNDFTDRINANPMWELAGIYSDEGISGTNIEHRKGMQQMLEDARAGKIDLILAKSIARFARNVVDCLSVIEELRNLNPPVGVMFDENNLYTLDTTGALVLTILATVAEEESRSKSFIMNWSIEKRFSRGIFLTPELLGYDKNEDGELVVNEDEAETVKVIYYLYLNGWSLQEIADLLEEYGRKTKLGNTEWNQASLHYVLSNERHCGAVLARKTFTPNFKDHKSVKNEGQLRQYFQEDHHEPIVTREVFNAANKLYSGRSYSQSSRPLPQITVVDDGILKGYVPIDRKWTGFSTEEYQQACESVYAEDELISETAPLEHVLDMSGYQRARSQYFVDREEAALTISHGTMRFSASCLRKFEDVEYVELLLNTVENCIAIRPCAADNENAIRWGKLKENRWIAGDITCRGLAKTLFDWKNWDQDVKYRFRGQFFQDGQDKMLLFELDNEVMRKKIVREIKTENSQEEQMDQQDAAEHDDGELVFTGTVTYYPESWKGTLGSPVKGLGVLEKHHYKGNWDVLRPAKAVEGMNILDESGLDDLMKKAEEIMEGWTKNA